MRDIDQATGNGAPMVQIAVDTDRVSGSGEVWFGGFADTRVNSSAAWERLITTRFGSGNSNLRVWDTGWNASYVGTAVISDAAETIEGAIPWSALGLSAPPTLPLRFTVATFRANISDNTWDIGGSGTSNALDAVTNYGSPAPATRLQNTWAEVSDGVVDYYFDVWFEPDGDPYPPLMVSEFQPNPPGADASREWIEIFNNSPVALSLDGIKVGDEETIAEGEGMLRFPAGFSIAPGATVIVALQADTGSDGFYYLFGFCPDFEVTNTTGPNCSAPNMSSYSAWASGSLALNNSDDEILILDGSDTVLDVAGYTDGGYTPYPGVTYLGWNSGWEQSVERRPAYQDTNDCSADFRRQYNPTPAQIRPDLVISKSGPAMAMPGGWITYTILYSNTGVNDAHGVVITDVLPEHASYVTDTSGLLCPACTPGATGTLTWTVGTVTPTDGLSFSLVLQVDTGAPLGSLLTNTIEIATPDPEVITTNNSAQFVAGISPLDLVVSKAGPTYGIVGRELVYTITMENRGVATATNVTLTDTLPLSTTYVSDDSGISPTCGSGVCVWSLGNVPSSTLLTFHLTVTVDSGVVGGTVLTNSIEASTETVGDNPTNNQARWTTAVYPMVSIHDIQYVPDPASDDKSLYAGQTVWVEGVVIADSGVFLSSSGTQIRYFIEDPAGGPWSGLYIYKGTGKPNVNEGDYVRLLGKVTEYVVGGSNQTELDVSASWALQQVISINHSLPAPEVITTGMLAGAATAEQWEGVLVEFRSATVTNPNLGYGEWAFDDGTGAARGDVWAKTGGNTRLTYVPSMGDYYKFIRGIGWQSYGTYKVEPRYDADIDLDYPTTFIYHDLEDVVHSGEAVYLAGSFNGWSTTATPMSANADFSVFSVTVTLEQTGTYEYKYVVYTDTAHSGPAQWDWLQRSGPGSNRSINVTAPHQVVDDYRNVAVGWAKLQWPPAITITLGQSTGDIYGRVYIHNVTNLPGEGRGIRAEVGYGTSANPAEWTWFPMTFNVDVDDGANDEFKGAFIPAAAGVYSYAVRFDGNWGAGNPNTGWTYGDLDGVHPTEPFELDQCGVLTVLAPSLSVAKSVVPQADVLPGGVVTYTVVLSNSGAGDALGVVLTDVLPAEVTFGGWVQQPTDAIYENGVITWTGTVTGGTEVRLVFTATLGTDSGLYNRTVVNTARFVSDNAGSGSAQATFATARRYWVYLPLVMRNWKP
jgi:uncharacterized repeat protein (TIGR01451 family)